MSLSDEDDRLLVARALGGDPGAWGALVDRYGGLVFATIRRAGVSRLDAEDVSQEVFQHLLRSLGTVRDCERLSGWLVTVARREAWRSIRAGTRPDRRAVAADGLVDESPETTDREEERDSKVRAAFSAIDERCQSLLRALFCSGDSRGYGDAAAALGISENSVGPIRNRCLQRLLAALERLGFEPSDHGFGPPAPKGCTDGRTART